MWPTDVTLTGSTTPDQSGPKSNGNEGVLHRTGTSPSDTVVSYQGHLFFCGAGRGATPLLEILSTSSKAPLTGLLMHL